MVRGTGAVRGAAVRHRRELAVGAGLFIAAAAAFRWAGHGFWSIDDAAITYDAAYELADHGSLAPYLEGTPAESYSNPLLFFVVTLLRLSGLFDPITTHVWLETLVFATMVLLVASMLRQWCGEIAAIAAAALFAVLELCTPATRIWYGSGLENVWASAGLVALVWLCARTSRGARLAPGWGVLAFLIAITHPEAPVHVAGFYIAMLAFARPAELPIGAHARQVVRALAVTAALSVVFLVWRRVGYGEWLPNTYYAKLSGHVHLARNLGKYVVASVLPYGRSELFAGSVLALFMVPRLESLAQTLLVFLVASLALPIAAGADWMGEQRFATAFFAVAHLSFAAFAAVCVAQLTQLSPKSWRAVHVLAFAAVLAVVATLKYEVVKDDPHSDREMVTIARVAEQQGGERWEHQIRLGLPYAVVQMPDAGGSLLIGAMQLIDNAYLTDYQFARLGRDKQSPADLHVIDQYEHEERRPDLVDGNPNHMFDARYLGTRYLAGAGHLAARRDLVEVTQIDPDAQLLWDGGGVQLYLSPETVRTAGPGGLVRCELIVAWRAPVDEATRVRARIEGGDGDEIALQPYQAGPAGIERRALLLGAGARTGTFEVSIQVVRDRQTVFEGHGFSIEVSDDERVVARAAEGVLKASSPLQAVRRVAWLREQLVPRLGMTGFHGLLAALTRAHEEHSARAGGYIRELRWNARLATLDHAAVVMRGAETAAMQRLFATCPASATDDDAAAHRVACLGRVVDSLRRLGYLGTLARMPQVARELEQARSNLGQLTPGLRYQALVGLTLADPADLTLQRGLIKQRLELAARGAYPDLM